MELVKRQDRWDLYGKDGSKIASSAPNPIGKLSLKNCEAIANGYDLDELAEEYNGHPMAVDWMLEKRGFKAGFQKALEILGDKKFTIEDIQNVIDSNEDSLVYQTVSENGDIKFYLDEDALTESLQQTEWDVEIVMDICGDKVYAVPEIVLDADGCLILKRI